MIESNGEQIEKNGQQRSLLEPLIFIVIAAVLAGLFVPWPRDFGLTCSIIICIVVVISVGLVLLRKGERVSCYPSSPTDNSATVESPQGDQSK